MYHEVWQGCGDQNNQPTVDFGGQDTPPRKGSVSLPPEEDNTTSSERGAESQLQDEGEDSEPNSVPTEEAEAGPHFQSL